AGPPGRRPEGERAEEATPAAGARPSPVTTAERQNRNPNGGRNRGGPAGHRQVTGGTTWDGRSPPGPGPDRGRDVDRGSNGWSGSLPPAGPSWRPATRRSTSSAATRRTSSTRSSRSRNGGS